MMDTIKGTPVYLWLKQFVTVLRAQLYRHLVEDSLDIEECLDGCSWFSSAAHDRILRQILRSCITDMRHSFYNLIFKIEILIMCKDKNFFGVKQLMATLKDIDTMKLKFVIEATDIIFREDNSKLAAELLKGFLDTCAIG